MKFWDQAETQTSYVTTRVFGGLIWLESVEYTVCKIVLWWKYVLLKCVGCVFMLCATGRPPECASRGCCRGKKSHHNTAHLFQFEAFNKAIPQFQAAGKPPERVSCSYTWKTEPVVVRLFLVLKVFIGSFRTIGCWKTSGMYIFRTFLKTQSL